MQTQDGAVLKNVCANPVYLTSREFLKFKHIALRLISLFSRRFLYFVFYIPYYLIIGVLLFLLRGIVATSEHA